MILKSEKKRKKGIFGNESGIALMLVLSAVTMFTFLTIQFADTTNVNYNLALNEKERVQAYFLARSSIELLKLELKLEKQMRANIGSSAASSAITGNLSGPLCSQFPLSTSLIRSMFLGEQPADEGEAAPAEGGETGEAPPAESTGPAHFISGLQVEAAKEFLDFEGDFEGTCEDEGGKFNLNIFLNKPPEAEVLSGVNDYDKSKQILIALLSRPELKKLFPKDANRKINELVRNIADWVDSNDLVNEMGRTTVGSETSLYPLGEAEYPVKNNRFLTLDEIFMVAGVTDSWFLPIANKFTVYGEDKINVCLATDEVVEALIVQFANTNQNIPDVNPEDKKKMKALVDVVKNGCGGVNPSTTEIANALYSALTATGTLETETPPAEEGTTAPAAPSGGGAADFEKLITTQSRYYTLYGSGIVGETVVKIKAILDTKDVQPARWKFVYWRVE